MNSNVLTMFHTPIVVWAVAFSVTGCGTCLLLQHKIPTRLHTTVAPVNVLHNIKDLCLVIGSNNINYAQLQSVKVLKNHLFRCQAVNRHGSAPC